MEFSKSFVLIIVSLCAINAIIIPTAESNPNPSGDLHDLIKGAVNQAIPHLAELRDLCKDGENVNLCIETIAPHIHEALEPVKAAVIEITATMNETLKVSNIIKALKEDPKTSKGIREALDICAEQYDLIKDTINKCLDLIQKNDLPGAWSSFSAVISAQSSCEDAFKESPGEPFPFAEDSKTLFQLGSNCLGILMRLSGETSPY